MSMNISVNSLNCHVGCLEIRGGQHNTEVTQDSETKRSMAECTTCGTVLRGFNSYALAVSLAMRHALDKRVVT